MPNDQEKIITFFNELASAVVHAIKKGTEADRKRLIGALEQMNAGMPALSEEDANAREYLLSLISLLVGEPAPPDGLVEPYAEMYNKILEAVFESHDHHHNEDGHGHSHSEAKDLQMKEFLTQIAASTVMVGKKGTDDEKRGLADRLREVHSAMPEHEKGPKALLLAFVSILDGAPVGPEILPSGYEGIYRKVRDEVSPGKS